MPVRFILASQSPRRRKLLSQLGAHFAVVSSGVEEKRLPGEAAAVYAARAAADKAAAVAQRRPDAWVLGADTVVVVDGEVIGKPRDRAHAARMLGRLSGRVHRVITAVHLRGPNGDAPQEVLVDSEVTFRRLAVRDIDAYLESDEPWDKAGAYAVQGRGASLVQSVSGSYTNVIGLPVAEVLVLLRRNGLLGSE